MTFGFGGRHSIQLSYGCIGLQIMSETELGQSRIRHSHQRKRRSFKPHRLSPFVLYTLPIVRFRAASATTEAILLLPSSFANRLVSLDFLDTHPHRT